MPEGAVTIGNISTWNWDAYIYIHTGPLHPWIIGQVWFDFSFQLAVWRTREFYTIETSCRHYFIRVVLCSQSGRWILFVSGYTKTKRKRNYLCPLNFYSTRYRFASLEFLFNVCTWGVAKSPDTIFSYSVPFSWESFRIK